MVTNEQTVNEIVIDSSWTSNVETSLNAQVTGRLRGTIVGPTGRPDPGYVRSTGR